MHRTRLDTLGRETNSAVRSRSDSESRKRKTRSSPEQIASSSMSKDSKAGKKTKRIDITQPKIDSARYQQTTEDDTPSNTAKTTTNMAAPSQVENLIPEKLENLESKMDDIKVKLDDNVQRLDGRIHDIEVNQEKFRMDVESVRQFQNIGEDLMLQTETAAKVSLTKSLNNEQYLSLSQRSPFNLWGQYLPLHKFCDGVL